MQEASKVARVAAERAQAAKQKHLHAMQRSAAAHSVIGVLRLHLMLTAVARLQHLRLLLLSLRRRGDRVLYLPLQQQPAKL